MAHKYKCRECGCLLDPDEMPVCDECRELLEKWQEQRKHVFGTPRPIIVRYEDKRAGA